MRTRKDLSKIKAIVLRHKWLMELDEGDSPSCFSGKNGRPVRAMKSSGIIEQAIQFVREHEGVRIIVVLDDEQLLMRDATWFDPLQRFAMELETEVVIAPRAARLSDFNPQFIVIRAAAVTLDEPRDRPGPKTPRLINAWTHAHSELHPWHGGGYARPNTSNGWVSIEREVASFSHVLTHVDFEK